jgi:predicted transcriptional regulator
LDELPAQTRKLLNHCMDWVNCQAKVDEVALDVVRFTRKQLRDATGWSDTALKVHLARLVEMEYLLVHLNGHRQRYHYELLYQEEMGSHAMLKLMDVENNQLKEADRSDQNDNRSGAGQAVVSAVSGGGQEDENATNLNGHKVWLGNDKAISNVSTSQAPINHTVKVSS